MIIKSLFYNRRISKYVFLRDLRMLENVFNITGWLKTHSFTAITRFIDTLTVISENVCLP